MGKEIVAMILAGGRGTRLEALTAKVAKPAVHFGGKYRIIDFPLSNCANSGIDVVGVLTQYESVLLGTYVGAGTKWGLDGNNSLAAILPARERGGVGATWYAGTADAIYQNISFLDQYDPEYVERAFNELDQCNTFGRLALAKALTILNEEDCSESLLREYLVDIYEFTEEDCEFTLAHINVDFHQEALDYAKYLVSAGYNKDEVREELELYQFNENQIQYALDNIS